jgi:hypothetical protein
MNREEYKANLLLFFLSCKNDIPEKAKWVAIDDDNEVYVYWGEEEPYLNTESGLVWEVSDMGEGEYDYFGVITFEFGAKTSLITVEELFDE